MKHLILIVLFIILQLESRSCSCGSYNYDFYSNITKHCQVGMLRIDSRFIYDSSQFRHTQFRAYLLKVYSMNGNVGDTLLFRNGWVADCMARFYPSNIGDTIIAIVDPPGLDGLHTITTNYSDSLHTHCGEAYIRIENKKHKGDDLNDIESHINRYLTSIEKHNEVMEITAYPNPFLNEIVFNNVSSTTIVKIDVFDVTGRIIMSHRLNDSKTSINTTFLKTGIYLFKLDDGTRQRTFKFVKE